MKQPRNIYGQPLTKAGAVDRRHHTQRELPNNGMAVHRYFVKPMPNDTQRPFHVMQQDIATGVVTLYSKHRLLEIAERRAERERRKEPGRRPKATREKYERRS